MRKLESPIKRRVPVIQMSLIAGEPDVTWQCHSRQRRSLCWTRRRMKVVLEAMEVGRLLR